MALACLASCCKPVSEILIVPVTRYVDYTVSCTKYVRDMGTKMGELDTARSLVEEHKKKNRTENLENPVLVDDWLGEVRNIKNRVNSFASDIGTCFNFKNRHKLGKEAFRIIEEIESLTRKYSWLQDNWTNEPIPMGKVDSMKESTASTPSTRYQDFASREKTFTDALEVLDPNHKSHMIALWGMGGVGKSTMKDDLMKVVKEKRMFNFIVEVVIGEKVDPTVIQHALADFFKITLQEKTKETRAARLRKCFEGQSDQGRNKILVILDDIWESVDLKDIGLPDRPNQDVNFKVLLTSREKKVCTNMGVNIASIIEVTALTDPEAQELFRTIIKESDDPHLDPDCHEIGDQIASKCKGLPMAIKTIACLLRGEGKDEWGKALSKLNTGDTKDIVNKIFQISYEHQDNESQSVFLLCGLYPEDFSIPTEELMRYCWGLKLFGEGYKINVTRKKSINVARQDVNICIKRLIDSNLLIGIHGIGWVKMHDLVRQFVLGIISKGEHPSIVNHGNMVEWPPKEVSESCKRLSFTCKLMHELPGEDLKYPNLTLLKIMYGDNLLRHTQDFYGGMEKLEVMAYESTHYLAFSRPLQCSNSLRTLCLEDCSLTFDYSFIGDLLNLEVLSFARSRIRKLPSTIGKLKKLKLLDLTGCDNLHIDSGVFKDLEKLEELYARVRDTDDSGYITDDRKSISFSDGSRDDLTECSKNLSALEVELFDNNAQVMDMSFEKLERFNISLRCFSKNMGENLLPSENKLMLVTSKGELLGSGMNKLFKGTNVLYLQVSDMSHLEEVDVDAISLRTLEGSLFAKLRFLSVSQCKELTYLFTSRIAAALSRLKDLEISSCPNLETLIHFHNRESQKITFPELKRLILKDLTKLSSLCDASNVIEFPQLIELELNGLSKITHIYPDNKLATSSDAVQSLLKEEVVISKLKMITVRNCESLVNLFPINPMPLMRYLEELKVEYCSSVQVLFNIDLGCLEEIEDSSNLKSIEVYGLERLKEVWRVKGVRRLEEGANNSNSLIKWFRAVKRIEIEECGSFRNLFTPSTASFDLGVLDSISLGKIGKNDELRAEQEMIDISKKEIVEVSEKIPNEVLFEIDIMGNNQQALLPCLEIISVWQVKEMRQVWQCNNWNEFFELRQPSNSSFHNVNQIYLGACNNIKYLFSPRIFKLLLNLKHLKIDACDGMEEVVSNRDDENNGMRDTYLSSPPLLEKLELQYTTKLRRIDGGGTLTNRTTSAEQQTQVDAPLWSVCQHSRIIRIIGCYRLPSLIPSHAVRDLENLEELSAYHCADATEVFESESTGNNTITSTCVIHEGSGNLGSTSQRFPDMINTPRLRNLTSMTIRLCERLTYIFTFSTLQSLRNLRDLEIYFCYSIQVIVKEEGVHTSKVVAFPSLKTLKLIDLPKLEAFFKCENKFIWPLLEEVEITRCPKMTRFTHGRSISTRLKYLKTEFGKYSLPEGGLNLDMTAALQETPFSLNTVRHEIWRPWSPSEVDDLHLPRAPWPVSDLIQINIDGGYGSSDLDYILENWQLDSKNKRFVSIHQWLQWKVLQKIEGSLEDVFQALRIANTSDIIIPKLTQIDLCYLPRLECIWKSNQGTVLEFPNLTKLSITGCGSLRHVLSCSMVGNLSKLQELKIDDCSAIEEIVKEEEECATKAKTQIIFPSLKSLSLHNLSNLKGFCLGYHVFQWRSLVNLEINKCPSLKVFTSGKSTAPRLKLIDTDFGTFAAKEGPNTITSIIEKATGTQIGKQLVPACSK